jgi:hypothetical protein
MKWISSKARTLALMVLFGSLSLPAFGQGCAMCYATARATPKEGQRALNRAILVMLVPPVSILVFGVGFAFRYGQRRDEEQEREDV